MGNHFLLYFFLQYRLVIDKNKMRRLERKKYTLHFVILINYELLQVNQLLNYYFGSKVYRYTIIYMKISHVKKRSILNIFFKITDSVYYLLYKKKIKIIIISLIKTYSH